MQKTLKTGSKMCFLFDNQMSAHIDIYIPFDQKQQNWADLWRIQFQAMYSQSSSFTDSVFKFDYSLKFI